MEKKELRKKFLLIRENIKNKELKSNIVTKKIINSDIYKNATVIALYCSFSSEVDTFKLIEYSLNNNKIVCLPKIFKNNNMKFYQIKNIFDIQEKNIFGICEPKSNFLIKKNKIDLMIIPGICFDVYNNRLGFGKGYYDRYLYKKNRIYKIGICFKEQLLLENKIDIDKYDIKMDDIIYD